MIDHCPDLVMLNQGCFAGCTVCEVIDPPAFPPALLSHALNSLALSSPLVYLGMEALAQPEVLPVVLKACGQRGALPVLITRGQATGVGEQLDLVHLLSFLRKHGPYTLLLALDAAHYTALRQEHLAGFLRAARDGAGVLPDVLYLAEPGEQLPPDMLQVDEVNQLCTIHTRAAPSLGEFLLGRESKFRRHDLVDVVDRAHFPRHVNSGDDQTGPLSSPPSARVAASVQDRFADGTPRLPNESQGNPYVLSFNSLVFETTSFCNAKCQHCYTSCGPDSSRDRLPVEEVVRVIEEAAALPNLKRRCSFGGGEATLFWSDLIRMMKHAQSCGFNNSLTTNGWWGSSEQKAVDKVAVLRDIGVSTIELSVDAMHQDFIRPSAIRNVIRAAKEAGIVIVLRICTTRTARADAVLARLAPDEQVGISIAMSKTTPLGRARETFPPEEIWLEPGMPSGACYEVLNLAVTPNGDVFPCCAGSELCPSLSLGNVFRQPLRDIMAHVSANVLVRTLVHRGPAHFARRIRDGGLGHKLRESYANYCHLCNDIFTDPELTSLVKSSVSGTESLRR